MTTVVYASKLEHDMWLFPHGRPGYPGVMPGEVSAARDACTFCTPPEYLGELIVEACGE
jgi:hypothetical protein